MESYDVCPFHLGLLLASLYVSIHQRMAIEVVSTLAAVINAPMNLYLCVPLFCVDVHFRFS